MPKRPFDPRKVLAQIAKDADQAPQHRLRAARLLMTGEQRKRQPEPETDPVLARTLELGTERNAQPGAMPICETHRGIGIHQFQPADRVAAVVKPAIDRVLALDEPAELLAVAGDVQQAPEARLLAYDRLCALDERRGSHATRVAGLEDAGACVAGLGALHWTDPASYASLFDFCPRGSNPPRRPDVFTRELQAAQAAARVRPHDDD